MSDIPCGLSKAECQEELFKLRSRICGEIAKLQEESEAYYYICSLVDVAPSRVITALQPLMSEHGEAYLEAWKSVIASAQKAVVLLQQMESLASIDAQLEELEAEEAPGSTFSLCSAHQVRDPECPRCNARRKPG